MILSTQMDFGFRKISGEWEIEEEDGKHYVVPYQVRGEKEGKRVITEFRVSVLLSETEPDPASRQGYRFHRAGLSLKGATPVEIEDYSRR